MRSKKPADGFSTPHPSDVPIASTGRSSAGRIASARAVWLPASPTCDAVDHAVLQALYDFYSKAEDILAKTVAAARQEFHDNHADRHAELDAITCSRSGRRPTAPRRKRPPETEWITGSHSGAIGGPDATLREPRVLVAGSLLPMRLTRSRAQAGHASRQ
jgi:hypothetical protein